MVRSGATSRLGRRLLLGMLFVAGWVLGVFLLGWVGAAPAAADTLGTASQQDAALALAEPDSPRSHGTRKPDTAEISVATSTDSAHAEAMAGRRVYGLTSQYTPGRTAPSAAEHTVAAKALAPRSNGGGSGPFGPGAGDTVRSVDDPRLMVYPVPLTGILPPVVRTAADDPSFSPD